MPAKYSHIKKKSVSGLLKKTSTPGQLETIKDVHPHHRAPNPHIDRSISFSAAALDIAAEAASTAGGVAAGTGGW